MYSYDQSVFRLDKLVGAIAMVCHINKCTTYLFHGYHLYKLYVIYITICYSNSTTTSIINQQ